MPSQLFVFLINITRNMVESVHKQLIPALTKTNLAVSQSNASNLIQNRRQVLWINTKCRNDQLKYDY